MIYGISKLSLSAFCSHGLSYPGSTAPGSGWPCCCGSLCPGSPVGKALCPPCPLAFYKISGFSTNTYWIFKNANVCSLDLLMEEDRKVVEVALWWLPPSRKIHVQRATWIPFSILPVAQWQVVIWRLCNQSVPWPISMKFLFICIISSLQALLLFLQETSLVLAKIFWLPVPSHHLSSVLQTEQAYILEEESSTKDNNMLNLK